MAPRKADLEGVHEGLFFETLGRTVRHSGVQVPDIPAGGDRHVASVRTAFDEYEPVLAKQPVLARIVDEARDEKFLLRPRREVFADCCAIVQLGETDACMRAARPDDHRKLQLSG